MKGRRPQVHYEEQRRALERFVSERGERLLRTAALLAGSRDAGEDLLQSALERLLRNWRRIDGDPESYVRRTLYNLATDGWRRHRVQQRHAVLFEPAPPEEFAREGMRQFTAAVRISPDLVGRTL